MEANLYLASTEYTAIAEVVKLLGNRPKDLSSRAVVFCSDQTAMMLESMICESLNGSFNTNVYSFGRFLRKYNNLENFLGKDGAVIAMRKVISKADGLKCFSNKSSGTLAQNMYDLIAQLKSACVTADDLQGCNGKIDGILKNKVNDIALIYQNYEQAIKGYYDDSELLSLLPETVKNSKELKGADVYFVCYDSWTKQAREGVKAIMEVAKSVNAVFVDGENKNVYTGSMPKAVKALFKELNISYNERIIKDEMNAEAKLMMEAFFKPTVKKPPVKCDNVFINTFENIDKEVEYVAKIIRKKVVEEGARYKDFTICTANKDAYGRFFIKHFNDYEINYNLDRRSNMADTVIGRLVLSYVKLFRYNIKREDVMAFLKNPLYNDKYEYLWDDFDNYLLKSGVYGYKFQNPFTLEDINLPLYEEIRKDFIKIRTEKKQGCVKEFVQLVLNVLDRLNIGKKVEELCKKLKEIGLPEQASLTEQSAEYLTTLLENCQKIMGDEVITNYDFYKILYTGMTAKEISVIPQYKDAVFIGDFKQTAISKAKYLFIIGLDSTLPINKADICLLTDNDIDRLERLKITVEPKIEFINQRERQNFSLAFTAFSKQLYLSYALSTEDKETVGSSVFQYINGLFDIEKTALRTSEIDNYLSKTAGKKYALKEIGRFVSGESFKDTAYVNAINDVLCKSGDGELTEIFKATIYAGKEESENADGSLITASNIGITKIENFYKCPYQCFLNGTVKLKDRDTADLQVYDTGNLSHNVFQYFMLEVKGIIDKKLDDLDENREIERVAKPIIDRVFDDDNYKRFKENTGLNQNIVERLKKECLYNCKKLFKHIKNSDFTVLAAEKQFKGEEVDLSLSIERGNININGTVDRVDVCRTDGNNYLRIIDYKTGSVDSSMTALASGRKLQLYLYANALERDGNKVVGSYYYQSDIKFKESDGDLQPDLAGITVDDGSHKVMKLMDKNLFTLKDGKKVIESNYIATELNLNKDGIIEHNKKKSGATATPEVFKGLMNYAKNIAKKGADSIFNGVKTASPYDGACAYCQYYGMCGFEDNITGNYRKLDKKRTAELLGFDNCSTEGEE